ncbi:hypothetical protein DOTSEDRAFT_123382 [Lecanosticta acicola]|uniref:SWIM-type domain-containing protein n=1 Tax=Lecanosticta acicola TaxID=111012 RepID=A0AAI8Z0E5_9PEZI|nr:hypothetical protein DOTSEDRAFT_123382 [Lecanosticta acicola]
MEASQASAIGAQTSGFHLRQFVSSLISAIPPTTDQVSANPLKDLPPKGKGIFLTLYALFEKEWLPALDLLDRGLIARLKPKPTSNETCSSQDHNESSCSFFLVRSAQQHNTRNASYEHVNYYEVRLDAWSCSCPAFTFSAFPASMPSSDTEDHQDEAPMHERAGVVFGGLTLGTDMPVCKHLLACVLIEHCQMFAHFADEREVSLEEMAGWTAGWGD